MLARSCLGAALLLAACARPPAELLLPDVRQATDFTCGAAALQAVLAYYGVEVREDRLARELNASPEWGVNPPSLIRVARAHGLRAELREQLTVDDLAREVRAGHPVILAVQAWSDRPPSSYQADWEDGHYLVVIGVDRDRIVFEDPSLLGSRGVLTARELEGRWHDTDGKRAYRRMGIIFRGRPSPPPPHRHVD